MSKEAKPKVCGQVIGNSEVKKASETTLVFRSTYSDLISNMILLISEQTKNYVHQFTNVTKRIRQKLWVEFKMQNHFAECSKFICIALFFKVKVQNAESVCKIYHINFAALFIMSNFLNLHWLLKFRKTSYFHAPWGKVYNAQHLLKPVLLSSSKAF